MMRSGDPTLRLISPTTQDSDLAVEVILNEALLRHDMITHSRNILLALDRHFADHRRAALPRTAMDDGASNAPHDRRHHPIFARPQGSVTRGFGDPA